MPTDRTPATAALFKALDDAQVAIERLIAEKDRLTADLAAARSEGAASRWHHSPDAPPEHFCEDCDHLREGAASRDAEVRALREAAIRVVDKRTLADEIAGAGGGYWVSLRDMRYLEEALAAGPAPVPAAGLDVERLRGALIETAAAINVLSRFDRCRLTNVDHQRCVLRYRHAGMHTFGEGVVERAENIMRSALATLADTDPNRLAAAQPAPEQDR